jgi:hypothetical protein
MKMRSPASMTKLQSAASVEVFARSVKLVDAVYF